jgi:hypothetical protein
VNILLVEPDFPVPPKSKNHKNFLPIGLLKIASYLRQNSHGVRLRRGLTRDAAGLADLQIFDPDEIWITSLFTYWSGYVREAVLHYKELFPSAKVIVGGIYASLMTKSEVKKYTQCDEVYQGVLPEAEVCFPAYDLVENSNPHPVDYQIVHASRGCERRCTFCGTWKIEPDFFCKKSIKDEIKFRKVVFYDNNLLMNPNIVDLLEELVELREDKKILWCESQSGFDGRILLKKPYLAQLLRRAGFRNPRIAWDWKYRDYPKIKDQIDLLIASGYHAREIFVFVLYNWDISFEEMEIKRIECNDWKVQIADCRYRPLQQLYDHYNSQMKGQTSADYYIHERASWTDVLVRQYRRNVRRQNICVRHGFPFYSAAFEYGRVKNKTMRNIRLMETNAKKIRHLKEKGISYWLPQEISR